MAKIQYTLFNDVKQIKKELKKRLIFKKCKKCKKILPITNKYFVKQKKCIDGFSNTCKICIRKEGSKGSCKTYSVINKIPKSKQKGYRICSKCLNELPLNSNFFNKDSRHKSGFNLRCKECCKEYRETQDNEKKIKSRKEYYLKNRELILNSCKQYREKNKDKQHKRNKKYREKNKDRIKKRREKYFKENRELIRQKAKKHAQSFAKYAQDKANRFYCDETKEDSNGLFLVKCKNSSCQKWFNPTNSQIQHRLRSIEGRTKNLGEENHFYCSDKCKKTCVLFKRRVEDILNAENRHYYNHECYYNASELTIWANQVKENANYTCEICGSKENLQAHHIEPKSINPEKALEPSNGLCLCKECHFKVHRENNGCELNKLRKCNVDI